MNGEVRKCDVCGVTNETHIIKKIAYLNCYLCAKHKAQMYRYGIITDPSPRTTVDRNEIRIKDQYAELIIRNKTQEIVGVALIDLDDVDKCREIKWTLDKNGYVRGGKDKVRLHRFLLNYNGDLDIDHINRNKLDNRKDNLRIVPRAINAQNNSAMGISYDVKTNKWRARIQRYGNYYDVGSYNTPEEAHLARMEEIKELDSEKEALLEQYELRKGIPETGIWPSPSGKWISSFCIDQSKHYVGTFETKKEAMDARNKAIKEHNNDKNYA